jgi:hypothetical protein
MTTDSTTDRSTAIPHDREFRDATGRRAVDVTLRETPEFDVPDGAPTAECPYCGQPFKSRRLWALHLGERHPGECTVAEGDAVGDATDEELDDLCIFHIKVVATLALLCAALVLAYMAVLGWG